MSVPLQQHRSCRDAFASSLGDVQRRCFEITPESAREVRNQNRQNTGDERGDNRRGKNMRLICPNCSAQYEVDAGLIPDEGRDVQCSNCGNTWFELSPAIDVAQEADVSVEDRADVIEQPIEDVYAQEPEPESFSEPEYSPEPEPSQAEPAVADEDDSWDWPKTRVVNPADVSPIPETEAEPEAPSPTRRPADIADLDVLREEAEHEISKRRSEATPIESQAEFGLAAPSEAKSPSRALRARMARLRGEDEGEAEGEAAVVEEDYQAPRRDLLPDIEEINSTLRPAGVRGDEPVSRAVEVERQRGFRIGFVSSVGLAAILVIIYAWAPAIASALPGTEQALITYVDWANSARDALDGLIADASDEG